METNYIELLNLVLQHYEEYLLNQGEELTEPKLLEKASHLIRGIAEDAYINALVELPFPKIRVLPDETLNVLYDNGDEGFVLFSVDETDKIKFMAKDSYGNAMSGIMDIKAIRIAPFLFFHV